MFLTRRLGLWEHLELEHLPKEGLRYWFANDAVRTHEEASETGGFVRSLVPSFQLRRDVLDQHVLDLAVEAGAELLRPARVRELKVGRYDHEVEIEGDGAKARVACRWLIDATGRACVLGRKLEPDRAQRAPSDRRHVVPLEGRAPHRRRRGARRRRPRQAQRLVAPPGDQSLCGSRLLGLVHPARQRRDIDRHRLGQAAGRPARAGRSRARLPRVPARAPSGQRADRSRRDARRRLPLLFDPRLRDEAVRRRRVGAGRRRRGVHRSLLLAGTRPRRLLGRGDDTPGARRLRRPAAGRPHRRAQRDVPALLLALLRRHLRRQVLLHGRERPALRGGALRHRAVLHVRGHPGLSHLRPLSLDAGAGAEGGLLRLLPPAPLQRALPEAGGAAARDGRGRAAQRRPAGEALLRPRLRSLADVGARP